ncbi:hypothetical protein AVA06_001406 [Salmonella enterica subsp. enterica]|nr:hypothetical protein [Salmonella enterica subsp. enterica]EED9674054.1 hypothetical protein [Salmonella enterica subsp. enterica]
MKCCALIALSFFFLMYAAVSEAWFKVNGDKRERLLCALSIACKSARKPQGQSRFPI